MAVSFKTASKAADGFRGSGKFDRSMLDRMGEGTFWTDGPPENWRAICLSLSFADLGTGVCSSTSSFSFPRMEACTALTTKLHVVACGRMTRGKSRQFMEPASCLKRSLGCREMSDSEGYSSFLGAWCPSTDEAEDLDIVDIIDKMTRAMSILVRSQASEIS